MTESSLTLAYITTYGFSKVGKWDIGTKKIKFVEDQFISEEMKILLKKEGGTLYAFVVGDVVKYVGVTCQSVTQRFSNHFKKDLIEGVKKEEVSVFIYYPSTSKESEGSHKGIKINLALGLEHSLIEELRRKNENNCRWNKKAKSPSKHSE